MTVHAWMMDSLFIVRFRMLYVRLLTQVNCKPTHFIFHSFTATIICSLQISFNSVLKDWADKYHEIAPMRY